MNSEFIERIEWTAHNTKENSRKNNWLRTSCNRNFRCNIVWVWQIHCLERKQRKITRSINLRWNGCEKQQKYSIKRITFGKNAACRQFFGDLFRKRCRIKPWKEWWDLLTRSKDFYDFSIHKFSFFLTGGEFFWSQWDRKGALKTLCMRELPIGPKIVSPGKERTWPRFKD